jgi:hypothetical protein
LSFHVLEYRFELYRSGYLLLKFFAGTLCDFKPFARRNSLIRRRHEDLELRALQKTKQVISPLLIKFRRKIIQQKKWRMTAVHLKSTRFRNLESKQSRPNFPLRPLRLKGLPPKSELPVVSVGPNQCRPTSKLKCSKSGKILNKRLFEKFY